MNDQLALGLQEHQRGLLAHAVRRYRSVLHAQPEHADALHLLGVALHQQGDHHQAAESIGRAVTLNLGNAAYHANLGEAHRALGNLERADECCRTALRLEPRSPQAANNLGLVLLAQGKTDEAILQFRDTLRIKPDYGMATNNLGNALRLGGDLDAALAHFRRAVEIEPNLAEVGVIGGIPQVQGDGPPDALGSLMVISLLMESDAKQVQGVSVLRLGVEDAAIPPDRLGQQSALVFLQAENKLVVHRDMLSKFHAV